MKIEVDLASAEKHGGLEKHLIERLHGKEGIHGSSQVHVLFKKKER